MILREPIFNALFGLVSQGEGLPGLSGVNWGTGQTFLYTSRRVRLWDDIKPQPALCQVEPDETYVRQPTVPAKRTFKASWIVYHQLGKGVVNTPAGAQANNNILDALDAAIAPPAGQEKQTLGGLVTHVWIEGRVFKDSGDLDGANQSLLIVPITILIP